jgi:hypothetical protein
VTLVDVSQEALNDLHDILSAAGLMARLEVELVCMDAWDYLTECDESDFDIIIATKCIGLVLGSGDGRTSNGFFDLVTPLLAPDGSFFCDHHLAFASPLDNGKKIVDVVPPALRPLATIGGRYSADVCYSLSGGHPDLDQVSTFTSPRGEHNVQVWQFFHFRLRHDPRAASTPVILSEKPTAPSEIPTPVKGTLDPFLDASFPINARGSKRVPSQSDSRAHDISTTRVKFDGVPGVLSLTGDVAMLVTSTSTVAFRLPHALEPPLLLTAELVPTTTRTSVVVVTGCLSIGDVLVDPLSYPTLASLSSVIHPLKAAGIIINSPSLLRCLKGNTIELVGRRGVVLRLPVDGLQLRTNGRDGVFVKPAPTCTIDSTPAEIANILSAAYHALGITSHPEVDGSTGDGVYEYVSAGDTHVWRRGRSRYDKVKSDTVGSAIHTIASLAGAVRLNLGTTVEDVMKEITR